MMVHLIVVVVIYCIRSILLHCCNIPRCFSDDSILELFDLVVVVQKEP